MTKTLLKIFFAATVLVSSLSCAQSENESRTVLITGANRGIGLELARQYSAGGWQVIGTARLPEKATALSNLDNTRVLQLDVTDQDSVNRFAGDLGDEPIDVLINNAGILPMMNSVPKIDPDVFSNILAVNTVGPVRVTQVVLPNLRKGKLKKIFNITSNLGSIAENTSGQFYGYRESKAALNMFTRSLAAELREEGFTCVVLHPGWVQTDMGGSQAPVQVEESAEGLRKVIDALTPEDNGTFWTWRGETMDW
ncbi:MAG: SDR family oxidoreductase [Gammaproteobacteria bacterium]|nr:SDR family oxidoreductase [Gammaproteobacteria bacterium]MDH5584594.1 SDR family oxidoreductase [Gammaproteobacteria bacterium]